MKRGDIVLINFDPSIGGEIKKTRPAVIVSNNESNHYLNRVQVVPISSNTKNIYPSETLIEVLGIAGKTMADQLSTVSKKRVIKQLSKVTLHQMKAIEQTIRFQLEL